MMRNLSAWAPIVAGALVVGTLAMGCSDAPPGTSGDGTDGASETKEPPPPPPPRARVDENAPAADEAAAPPSAKNLPTALPPGTELVDLGLVSVVDGRAPEIEVDVDASVYSFVVMAYANDGTSVLLERAEAPDGSLAVDDAAPAGVTEQEKALTRGFPGPFYSANRTIPSTTSGAFLLPNSPDVAFPPGTWKLRVGAYNVVLGQRGAAVTPDDRPIHLAVLVRSAKERPSEGKLDLTLVFSGSSGLTAATAPTDENLSAALGVMRSAYALVDVDLGDITYEDLPDESLQTVVLGQDTCDGADLDTLFAHSVDVAENHLNLFFVDHFQCIIFGSFDLGQGIGGISGGIPGMPYARGTNHSGVAVSTSFFREKPDLFAVVMAHESGHFLGLYHSQENNQFGGSVIYDNISDTPDSPSGAETNLMYFSAQEKTTLTPGQGFVMRNNPWVTP